MKEGCLVVSPAHEALALIKYYAHRVSDEISAIGGRVSGEDIAVIIDLVDRMKDLAESQIVPKKQ